MPKFTVRIRETQYWVYEYEVDVEDECLAENMAIQYFNDGKQADDSWIDEACLTDSEVETQNA